MAYGYEILLGFPGAAACHAAAEKLGITLGTDARYEEIDDNGLTADKAKANEARIEEINALLLEAQKEIFQEAGNIVPGFVWVGMGRRQGSDDEPDPIVDTPEGRHLFSRFGLYVYLDELEMGEDAETDAVLCVPLSGRYRPTFLDWRSGSGALHTLALDEEFQRLTSLAKEKIAARLPAFADAVLVVKPIHY